MTHPGERETALLDTLVNLADSLVGDFDVIELTERLTASCVRLLAVDAAGLVLANPRGGLQVMTSTTESTHQLETQQIQLEEGPCIDAYRRAAQITTSDLADATARWPRFAPEALRLGFHAVHALPLRLREQTIGAMNLFSATTGPLPALDLHAGQALADVATIAVLQHRTGLSPNSNPRSTAESSSSKPKAGSSNAATSPPPNKRSPCCAAMPAAPTSA